MFPASPLYSLSLYMPVCMHSAAQDLMYKELRVFHLCFFVVIRLRFYILQMCRTCYRSHPALSKTYLPFQETYHLSSSHTSQTNQDFPISLQIPACCF